MLWFPSAKSLSQSLYWLFTTSLLSFVLRVLGVTSLTALGIGLSFTEVLAIPSFIWLIALATVVPILLYGYLDYILFGKEKKSFSWLLHWQSLGEGIWMWLIVLFLIFLVVSYALLRAVVINHYINIPFSIALDIPITQVEANLGFLLLILIPAYLYHWRTLFTKWVKRVMTKKADP